MRTSPLVISTLLTIAGSIGCGGRSAPPPVVEHPPERPIASAGPPQLAEGVVAMEPTCAEGLDERCDALDSDCDGRIDEGCDGAIPGELDVAVAWNGRADLDLILEGPGAADAATVSADGACGDELDRIERRSLERARPGRYTIEVRSVDACGGEGPVTASVTISVGGHLLGTFNRPVPAGDTAPVLVVDVE